MRVGNVDGLADDGNVGDRRPLGLGRGVVRLPPLSGPSSRLTRGC